MANKKGNLNAVADYDEFPMGFQPICNIDTGEHYGYEALMRIPGKNPESVIAEYRDSGQLHRLEFSTFVNAINQFKKQKLSGKLFINSFPGEVLGRKEMRYIQTLMGNELFGKIVVEILEIEHTNLDMLTLRNKLTNLRFFEDMFIAIDDFGVGEDSFNFLRFVRPDIVKIDQYFVKNIDTDVIKKNMLDIILSYLVHEGYIIMAEGVETKMERDYLKSKGITLVQGFLYGKAQTEYERKGTLPYE